MMQADRETAWRPTCRCALANASVLTACVVLPNVAAGVPSAFSFPIASGAALEGLEVLGTPEHWLEVATRSLTG